MINNFILSDYLEQKLMNHIFKNVPYTPPSHVYLALHYLDVTDSTVGSHGEIDTEYITGPTGYTRMECPEFTITESIANPSEDINFNTAILDWGTIVSFSLKDDSRAGYGNILFYGNLTTPLTINEGNTLRISASSLSISLVGNENGGWGAGTASTVLDFVLNNGSFSSPGDSIYLALGRALTTDASYNLLSWLEISGEAGYARRQISSSGWNTPSWSVSGDNIIENANDIIFTQSAEGNWGNVVNTVFFNSSSGGDPLIWGKLTRTRNVLEGDGIRFLSGSINVGIDTTKSLGETEGEGMVGG